ncbi:hypothetical protein HELRODRAFT_109032, partial [Helobdella robusta]|uniref:FAD dependent oxidoreductase domain-containing protein n=1 Tax=Helobdella robusta TaxID=6412 RepID=T1EEQ1_HELRO
MKNYLIKFRRHFLLNKNFTLTLLNRSYSRVVSPETLRDDLPSEAQVVIGGGGLLGCSVAYHLARSGITDVVVLEKGKLGCGTTWLGSGVVGRLRSLMPEIELVDQSYKLYTQLHNDGYDIGYQATGSLNLCRTPDRVTAYKRNLLLAESCGVEGEMVDAKTLAQEFPFMKCNDLLGAMRIPGDICIDQMKLLNVLVDISKSLGVKFVEGCQIGQVHVKSRMVASVETDHGMIRCADFVNCTGQWARELGKHTSPYGINIPVHASQLSEMQTQPLPELKELSNMPLVRDYDGHVYFREMNGGILGGGFPPSMRPLFHDGIPDNVQFKLLPEDWDNFHVILEQLLHRLPLISRLKATELRTGYDSFTPDGRPILGVVPELLNYFVAAGFNCAGAAMAGGVGKVMAEWVKDRSPRSINLWPLDVRRFVGLHNNRKFLKERVTESSLVVSGIPYWEVDMIGYDSGRRLRTSAIFTRNEPYAVFGQIMGYERPLFFHTQGSEVTDDDLDSGQNIWTMPKPSASIHGIHSYQLNQSGLPPKGSFGKPPWFDNVKSEYWACREGVCIIDMSTYSKFELRSTGQEVVKFLQYICSNDVDKPVGSVVHTGMQNEMGGFENDCSIIRLQSNRYFMIGPTVQQTRSYVWMRDHLPRDGSVQLTDVTSMYTALNVIGPKAQELLSELTDRSLKKKDFMFMTHKEINLAMASHVRAMRLTHTGEDGWVLY